MQVTNSATIVDYFPEAFVAQDDNTSKVKRFIRRVTWRDYGTKSYSVVTASDAQYDWQCRINKGDTVTNFNTEKMPRSEYMPMSC